MHASALDTFRDSSRLDNRDHDITPRLERPQDDVQRLIERAAEGLLQLLHRRFAAQHPARR